MTKHTGCDRVNASSRCRDGRPTSEALAEDLAAMLALPAPKTFDAVRWVRARADKRGYVEACGNRYCAGPAWHGRELVVGLRVLKSTFFWPPPHVFRVRSHKRALAGPASRHWPLSATAPASVTLSLGRSLSR